MRLKGQTCTVDREFVAEVENEIGTAVAACYQCGKCTADCPLSFSFDYTPNQILRLMQLGQKEMVLRSESLWYCATCYTCTIRCPKEIDIAKLMSVLLIKARDGGYVADNKVRLAQETFVNSVARYGRVFEAGLVGTYNLKSGDLFNNADIGPRLLATGKLRFLPHRIKGRREIRKIFDRLRSSRKGKS